MAIDKAVDSAVLETNLTAVANAIRAKTGSADPLAFPAGMVEAIAGFTGGEDLDAELANQDELIEQIMTAIEGKVAGGGGGGSVFAVSGAYSDEAYAGAYTTTGSAVIE